MTFTSAAEELGNQLLMSDRVLLIHATAQSPSPITMLTSWAASKSLWISPVDEVYERGKQLFTCKVRATDALPPEEIAKAAIRYGAEVAEVTCRLLPAF